MGAPFTPYVAAPYGLAGSASTLPHMSIKKPPRLPPSFTLDSDGEPQHFSKFEATTRGAITGIEVEPCHFSRCPICGQPDPDHAEHVPPKSLGGQVLTSTCQRCNNDFGTAEEQLRRFVDLETEVRVQTHDGSVKGPRRGTVVWRSGTDGSPVAFIQSAAPEFDTILGSGGAELTVTSVDLQLVAAAWLKHAYLAACLHQQDVPQSVDVERVRCVLLATRDRDRSALAAGLQELKFGLFGWVDAAGAPPVLLVESMEADPHWLFLFGGHYVVPWPFADVPPRPADGPTHG